LTKALLAAGADVPNDRPRRHQILSSVIQLQDPELVSLVLEKGAKADVSVDLLTLAIHLGNRQIITLLLANGAARGAQPHNTALVEALNVGASDEIIEEVLQQGGAETINAVTFSGSALKVAIEKQRSLAIIRLLIKAGANVNEGHHATPLELACHEKRWDVAHLLLDAGADVNSGIISRRSAPLRWVFTSPNSDPALIRRFIEDPKCDLEHVMPPADNDPKKPWTSALMYAARWHPEVVPALLRRGVDVNASNEDGSTALMWAANAGDLATVTALLNAGARLDVTDRWGKTPLMCALRGENLDVVKLILQSGATDFMVDRQGRTPLMLAIRSPAIVAWLLDRRIDLDWQDGTGNTALLHAVKTDQYATASQLLDAGADWSIPDTDQKTALQNLPAPTVNEDANLTALRQKLTAKAAVELDPDRSQLRAQKQAIFANSSLFPEAVSWNMPVDIQIRLQEGNYKIPNPGVLVAQSKFLLEIAETGEKELILNMDRSTFDVLRLYSEGKVISFKKVTTSELLKMLTAFTAYFFDGAAALVEKELMHRVSALKQEAPQDRAAVEVVLDAAIRLHCRELGLACRRWLHLEAEPLPNTLTRAAPTAAPGFHRLYDADNHTPKAIGADGLIRLGMNEWNVHLVVLRQAGISNQESLQAALQAGNYGELEVTALLRFLYTGKLAPELDEEAIFRLATLAKTLNLAAPFQQFLAATYLDKILESSRLAGEKLSEQQRKRLGDLSLLI
jgi:ankyrin repeat protein